MLFATALAVDWHRRHRGRPPTTYIVLPESEIYITHNYRELVVLTDF
jgi:hypothetical protein